MRHAEMSHGYSFTPLFFLQKLKKGLFNLLLACF